jgi:hypothetical protein
MLVAACGGVGATRVAGGAGGDDVDPRWGDATSTSAGSGGAGATSGTSASSTGAGATTSSSGTTSGTSVSSTGAGATTGGGGDPFEAAAQLCVDTINQYRATLSLPPLARWSGNEICVGTEAQKDAEAMTAHSAFGSCGESAQNECPGWPGPPDQMIGSCLQMMWDEGPGADYQKHGHYINMSNPSYTKVACGFYVIPGTTTVWAAQDFH